MIPVEQAYERFLQKVEKNITNDNISTSRGNFVILFNESQNKFSEENLQQRGVDDIRYIQHLLILDKRLSDGVEKADHFDFKLPNNYLDIADARATATKRICTAKLELWEIQAENLNSVLSNQYDKPSFEWREAPFIINSNNISVYTDKTFKVDSISLDYYRYPKKISLVNEFDPESKFSEIEIEWDDKALDRIISYCAGEFDINESNPRFQLQKVRQQK